MKEKVIYKQITNQLIEILDTHKKLDYTCNRTSAEVMAKNIVTGRNYNGSNQIYLSFIASRYYNFNRWISFKQGSKLHATVKKGEHSRLVTFWKFKLILKMLFLQVHQIVFYTFGEGYRRAQILLPPAKLPCGKIASLHFVL